MWRWMYEAKKTKRQKTAELQQCSRHDQLTSNQRLFGTSYSYQQSTYFYKIIHNQQILQCKPRSHLSRPQLNAGREEQPLDPETKQRRRKDSNWIVDDMPTSSLASRIGSIDSLLTRREKLPS